MAELADALDLSSSILLDVRVQLPPGPFRVIVTVTVAQLVRALDCGSRGQEFKSPQSPFIT